MLRLVGVLAVCALVIGCGQGGPPLGQVSGVVTLDGEPMENVLVTFTPEAGGRSSTGTTDASGEYTLAYADQLGAVIGSHKVAVTTLQDAASSAAEMSSDDPNYAKQGTAADYAAAEVKEKIPEKYNIKTELVKKVTSGSNTIDLELTSS